VLHNNNIKNNNRNNNINQSLGDSSPLLTSMQALTTEGSDGVTAHTVTADNVTADKVAPHAEAITGSTQGFALPKTRDVKSKTIADVFALDDSTDEPSLRTKYPLLR
jgi:hypothetical protein